jgi:Domain of unknown function (DUF4338)
MGRENVIRIRGRDFNRHDIDLISRLVRNHFARGRTFASVEICKALNWKQPNGWLKERACRDVLRVLERRGVLKLPPSKQKTRPASRVALQVNLSAAVDSSPISSIDFRSVTFVQVKGKKKEGLWNSLVREHHYLGFKGFVGRNLKYLVYAEDRIIAALGMCDPAWSVAPRDKSLAACGFTIDAIRSKGINNGRFLVMPWVRVDNLASFLLGAVIRHVVRDWRDYYLVEPEVLETFVDGNRFKGTCYKAANWLYIGQTKGYKKSGGCHQNSQAPKMVFVYPVKQTLRQALTYHLKRVRNVTSHRRSTS